MTEQEAQAEAVRRYPLDWTSGALISMFRQVFLEGAAWGREQQSERNDRDLVAVRAEALRERSRLSPRVVEAAPAKPVSDTDRHELIEAAVKAMMPSFTNETAAWNAWNNLNTSPAFIAAIRVLHPQSCEHGIALSDLCLYAETIANEPVQVEVTADMVERAAQAVWDRRPRPTDPAWSVLDNGVRKEYRDDALAALSAALGGGDRAE